MKANLIAAVGFLLLYLVLFLEVRLTKSNLQEYFDFVKQKHREKCYHLEFRE